MFTTVFVSHSYSRVVIWSVMSYLNLVFFLSQVLEASDVVLEVLDARDPMGCRCPQLEQAVTCSGGNKKLLLVLNKIGKKHRFSPIVTGTVVLW